MLSIPPEKNITPDRWVIVELNDEDGNRISKLLTGAGGGLLGTDSWRFSSKIVEINDEEKDVLVTTETGSTYICKRSKEGMTTLMSNFFEALKSNEKTNAKMIVHGDQT